MSSYVLVFEILAWDGDRFGGSRSLYSDFRDRDA